MKMEKYWGNNLTEIKEQQPMSSDLKKIDYLQENCKCHYIDILPQRVTSQDYFELEEYLLNTFLQKFSERIINIILKLIHYYPTKIYLTEFYRPSEEGYESLVEQNLRSLPLTKIADIISYVIMNDNSSIQVLLEHENQSLISINGHFSVDIYNASPELLSLLNLLVTQENLFLREE